MLGIPLIVRTKQLQYKIDIQSKFTIIRGSSGTGKTTLIQLLNMSGTQVECPLPVEVLPAQARNLNRLTQQLKEDYADPCVFIADEDFHYITDVQFQAAAKDSKHLFILITRNKLASIPYAISDIWKLETIQGVTTTVPLYPRLPYPSASILSDICVEDKEAGLRFFQSIADFTETSDGKDNIPKKMLTSSYTLFVIDSLSAGSTAASLFAGLAEDPSNQLLLLDSFEALVYKSEFCQGQKVPDIFCNDKEEFYTNKLKQEFSRVGRNYSKDGTIPCLIQECCYTQKCELYKAGNKQRMILGKLYQIIMRIADNHKNLGGIPGPSHLFATPPTADSAFIPTPSFQTE